MLILWISAKTFNSFFPQYVLSRHPKCTNISQFRVFSGNRKSLLSLKNSAGHTYTVYLYPVEFKQYALLSNLKLSCRLQKADNVHSVYFVMVVADIRNNLEKIKVI